MKRIKIANEKKRKEINKNCMYPFCIYGISYNKMTSKNCDRNNRKSRWKLELSFYTRHGSLGLSVHIKWWCLCVCVFACCCVFFHLLLNLFFPFSNVRHSLRRFGLNVVCATLNTQFRLNAMQYKIQYKIQNNGMERNGTEFIRVFLVSSC